MKMPNLPFKLPDWPRRVAVSVAVLAGSAVAIAILYPTLGLSHDAALERVTALTGEAQSTESKAIQAATDYDFVIGGKERYEKLIAGDKLVPHARRDAVAQMQTLGREFGLSTVNYSFKGSNSQSPTAQTAQPRTGDYRVNIESIEISIAAPFDGMIYGFIAAMLEDFPGAIVVDKFELGRQTDITAEALNAVARGQSQLVGGKLDVTWRTAQRNAEPAKPGGR